MNIYLRNMTSICSIAEYGKLFFERRDNQEMFRSFCSKSHQNCTWQRAIVPVSINLSIRAILQVFLSWTAHVLQWSPFCASLSVVICSIKAYLQYTVLQMCHVKQLIVIYPFWIGLNTLETVPLVMCAVHGQCSIGICNLDKFFMWSKKVLLFSPSGFTSKSQCKAWQ